MTFKGLNADEIKKLEFEVVSQRTRLNLSRLLRASVQAEGAEVTLIKQNARVNVARTVLGLPLYVLVADEWGDYHPFEYAWHNGELELVMRRPTTVELVETLADLIAGGMLFLEEVNEIVRKESGSFSFKRTKSGGEIRVGVSNIQELDGHEEPDKNPNVRLLVDRMDRALEAGDFPGVLHSSATIFETLAKDLVRMDSVQDLSLGRFFEEYRNESRLPAPVLDYVIKIFKWRNTEPLAGHGSTKTPKIGRKDAIVLAELTKVIVRMERRLASPEVDLDKTQTLPKRGGPPPIS